MATIINADTSNGLKLTSDTSGQLELQSAGSTKVTMDTSGKVGIGGTPSEPLSVFRSAASQTEGINIRNTTSGYGSRLTFETTRSDDSSVQEMAAVQVYAVSGYDSAANSDAVMTFETQNSGTTTEHMRIDSSGYVTEPNKPMAFATGAPQTSTSPGSPIVLKYALATYNPGSHYNTTTGLFTCPVAGRYKITQHAMAIASAYNFSISITKNGGGLSNGYTSNTTYNISTCMAIINCAANDTLSATLNHGTKHPGFDSFTVEFLG